MSSSIKLIKPAVVIILFVSYLHRKISLIDLSELHLQAYFSFLNFPEQIYLEIYRSIKMDQF